MVTKQFQYSRRLYINTRQDTRDEGRDYSKINIGKNIETCQFSLIIEGSALTGLRGTRPKMVSISFKTYKLHVAKLEKQESLRLESKSIIFAIFAILYLLC